MMRIHQARPGVPCDQDRGTAEARKGRTTREYKTYAFTHILVRSIRHETARKIERQGGRAACDLASLTVSLAFVPIARAQDSTDDRGLASDELSHCKGALHYPWNQLIMEAGTQTPEARVQESENTRESV